MKYSVAITERAAREIEETAAWWAGERSTEQAQRWYQGIHTAIAGLATLPERCPLVAERIEVPYEIRQLQYGLGSRPTHRVIFSIVRETVIVLTVRHVARGPLQADDLA